jgi:hypothetical protein
MKLIESINAANTMNIIEKLQQLSSCMEIAHHVPGHIRLRPCCGKLSRSNTRKPPVPDFT